MARNLVITVARGCGSGGGEIARKLAAELNINYYDKKLLRLASDDSGISEQLFAEADERIKKSLLFKVAKEIYRGEIIPPESEDFLSNKNLFSYQAKVIKALAQKESCVIIGRCADHVLQGHTRLLRVYISAPLDACLKRKMEATVLSKGAMLDLIRKSDKYRSDYYSHYTGKRWDDPANFDLCLNSESLGVQRCVDIIKSLATQDLEAFK